MRKKIKLKVDAKKTYDKSIKHELTKNFKSLKVTDSPGTPRRLSRTEWESGSEPTRSKERICVFPPGGAASKQATVAASAWSKFSRRHRPILTAIYSAQACRGMSINWMIV